MLRRLLPLLLMLSACRNTGVESTCSSNSDCQGDRVCVNGHCSQPKASGTTAQTSPSPTMVAATASASNAPREQGPTPVLGDFCFKGTLGDQAITGVLKAMGNQVHGEYSRAEGASGSKLKLTGTRAAAVVALKEQAGNGRLTGSFDGTVTPGDGHYRGTWSSAGEAKKLPFDLSPTGCGPEYW